MFPASQGRKPIKPCGTGGPVLLILSAGDLGVVPTVYTRTWQNRSGSTATGFVVEAWIAGQRHRRQFSTQQAAKKYEHSLIAGAEPTKACRLTFAQVAERYLADLEINDRDRSTIASYRSKVKCHLNPEIGSCRIDKVTKERVREIRISLRAKLSSAQAFCTYQTLCRILRYAVDEQLLTRDPAAGLKVLSRRKLRHERGDAEGLDHMHRFPSPNEVIALRRALSGVGAFGPLPITPATIFVAIAFYAGLRASEIRGLTVGSLMLGDVARIRVFQRCDDRQVIGPLKSTAAYRSVPVPQRLAQLLGWWIKKHALNRDDLLVSTREGTPLNPSNFFKRDFQRFLIAAGIPLHDRDCASPVEGTDGGGTSLTIHSLRHCYASLSIRQGIDIKTLTTRMGHSSIKHTLDIYGHLWRDDARDARDMQALESSLDALEASACELETQD